LGNQVPYLLKEVITIALKVFAKLALVQVNQSHNFASGFAERESLVI
jgi:hypothetical protein